MPIIMTPGSADEITIDRVVDEIVALTAALRDEYETRQALEEDISPNADSIIPGQFRMLVEHNGRHFYLADEAIPVPSLAPLVPALRAGGAARFVRIAERLQDKVDDLNVLCHPPGQQEHHDGDGQETKAARQAADAGAWAGRAAEPAANPA
jgi:hypothetical protein